MRLDRATLIFCLLCSAARAQSGFVDNNERTMSCEDRDRGDTRPGHCEVHEQTLASTGSLRVDASPNGGVTVKGWSQAGVLVRAKVEAWGNSASEAQSLFSAVQLHAVPGQVNATGPKTQGDSGWSVSYEVFVPHKTGLELQSVNGGVHVSDVEGTMDLHAVNGGVHLSRLGGDVTATTVNGGVHVNLMGDHWEGHGLQATSTNGGVHVSVPQSYSAQFEGSTVNGHVRSDFAELNVVKDALHSRPQTLSGSLGRGGATIHAATTNGGLVFERQ